jgi:hypothetical protein
MKPAIEQEDPLGQLGLKLAEDDRETGIDPI